MANYIGELVKKQRKAKGLKRSYVAVLAGYSNISKGSRKILELERDGKTRSDLLENLLKILEISKEEFRSAYRKEKVEFEAWLDKPIQMEMIVRYAPAIYVTHALPDQIKTAEEAAQFVMDFTSDKNLKACLVFNRRWSFWAEKGDGVWRETTYESQVNKPYMTIGGRPLQISADAVCETE